MRNLKSSTATREWQKSDGNLITEIQKPESLGNKNKVFLEKTFVKDTCKNMLFCKLREYPYRTQTPGDLGASGLNGSSVPMT